MGQARATEMIVFRIGVVGPLTGPNAQAGNDSANGVRLALEKANAAPGVVGGRQVRFEGTFLDDAGDPRLAVVAAQKLCDMNVVGVVGHVTSGAAVAAAGVYEGCGIPNLSPSATSPELTRLGYKNTFRLTANDARAAGAMARFVAKHKLVDKRVAIIDDRTSYGEGFASAFEKAAGEAGLSIVAREFTQAHAVDLTGQLLAIKRTRPDVLVFAGMYGQAALLLRQMQRLRMENIDLVGGDGICTDLLPSLLVGAKEVSVYCVEGGEPTSQSPKATAFRRYYETRFPNQYVGNAMYAYDATLVLASAVLRAQGNHLGVRDQLSHLTYDGLTGRIQFDQRGDRVDAKVSVYRLSKEGRKLVEW
ncbi:branched chain amino acid ABC transporter substrate-binding protein [Cupriavidus pauculus]|uniref:Branched chain amino acid ABC transporter substrate-binding protein n=2 Tax=Cupriavidus pauculus TaxID=82633 RepID=A0A2N5C2M0_9BURK|nr:branched chain amino acid ABC transporter substrate-binding protein [Cupriavidus pauculus]